MLETVSQRGASATVGRPIPARYPWLGLAGYVGLLLAGVGTIALVLSRGEGLAALPTSDNVRPVGLSRSDQVDIVLHVTATLAAVIGLGVLVSRVFRYLGQPPVIGEVVAGILLGPSVLGAIAPDLSHFFIPSAAADPQGLVPATLKMIAQLGAILYLFLVGLELNAAQLAGRAHAAIAVSHSSIVVPFVLGTLLALGLYPVYSHSGVPFTSFALFMGVAMSITAFPVLARILTDHGLAKSELGCMAISCAAADDVTAWCLLALVVGVAQSSLGTAGWVISGAIGFIAVMFLIMKPAAARLMSFLDAQQGPLPSAAIAGTYMAVLLSAWMTEAIGVHAVFGAFLLGAIIPHDCRLARQMTSTLHQPVTVLLLPAFFAYTGMRTQISLVSGWESVNWCGAIILVATAGKFGGTLVAARLSGLNWRDAVALGTLMNTRGLMELIVLNIGLDLGVISPTLFAMMVIMALATTAVTAPVIHWLIPPEPNAPSSKSQPA